jgi:hypothetical protein
VEELIRQQEKLTEGLKKLYIQIQSVQNQQDCSIKELHNGVPHTHQILEQLGILKDERCDRASVITAGN